MPIAILKSIREVSSEDRVHSASNLLQNEPANKWKTGDPGEKSAYVVIEMEKDYSIKGIDIGNECSAFVEVLVGGPTCPSENFKEILVTCSFMTPTESKICSMPNRVRCFGREALVKEIASEKWKLLKIVCTQPFNRDIKYGLSFIKVHVDEPEKTKTDTGSNGESNRTVIKGPLASFFMRDDSPDSDSESTNALFNRWRASKNNKQLSGGISSVPRDPSPAALRKTNESPIVKKTTSVATPLAKKDMTKDPVVHDRNRNSLLFTDDDNDEQSVQEKRKKKLEKLEKAIAADQERVTKETEKAKKPKKQESSKNEPKREEKSKRDEANISHSDKKNSNRSPKTANTPSTSRQRRRSSSPCISDNPKKPKLDKPYQYKPFNELLDGVVLVISGIQNPDRADLRSKALALGAKYKADWDSSSTHLICAFKNTPKYNQVKGVGKIVTRSWIEDCFNKKRKIPWRRYALDSKEILKPESEDEILDDSLKPQEESKPVTNRNNSNDSDDILTIYDNNETKSYMLSSGSDTEDEIQKVLAKKSPLPKKVTQQNDDSKEILKPESEDEILDDSLKPQKESKPVTNRNNSNDSDDILTIYDNNETESYMLSSGSDTEDEIQKVLAKKSPLPKKVTQQNDEVFEVSTEEEEYVTKKKLNKVPDKTTFFKKMKFFISDQLNAALKIKVERYIESFDGVLTTSIDEANYLIANNCIANVGEFKGETVTPLWILECFDAECFIPTKRYLAK